MSLSIQRRSVTALLLVLLLIICNAPQAQEQTSFVTTTWIFPEPNPVYLFTAPSRIKIAPRPVNLPIVSLRSAAPTSPINGTVPFKMSAAQALKIGNGLFLDEEFEEALPYFEESHRSDANSIEALAGLGDCYYELQRDNEAIAIYKEVIGRSSQIWRTHFNLGRIYLEHGQFVEAYESFVNASKIKPTDIDTISGLGLALEKQGKNAEAIPYLTQVTQAEHYNQYAFYALAEAYANDKQYQKAAEIFFTGAEKRGIDPDAYSNWATMIYYTDNLEEAIKAYAKVKSLDLDQSHVESSVFLADAFWRTKRPNDALASYRHVLKFRPNDVDALVFAGYLCLQLGQLNDAEQYYKRLIVIDPRQPDAVTNLAALQSRDNEKLVRKGEPTPGITLREVAAANPNLGEAYVNLGAQLMTERVYPEAATNLQRAVTLMPESAAANFNFAFAQLKTGDFEKAVASINKALQLRPAWTDAYNILGLAYAGLNRWEDASRAYLEAVRIKPDYAGAHYNLGIAYMKMGNKTAALREVDLLKPLNYDLKAKLSNWIFSPENATTTAVATEPVAAPVSTPTPVPAPTAAPFANNQVSTQTTIPTPTAEASATPAPVVEKLSGGKGDKGDSEITSTKATVVEKTCPGPIYRPTDVTQMAQITSRIEVAYTDEARTNNVEGKLVLQAFLCGNGIVSDIAVEQPLPYGLTERAIEAMKKIQFQPALYESKPVSVMVKQEFVCSQGKCTATGTGPK